MSDTAPILVLNAGSATLKYRLVRPAGIEAPARQGAQSGDEPAGIGGSIEHIGEPDGPDDHAEAVRRVLDRMPDARPVAVGHRVVHGGPRLRDPVRVDAAVEATIEEMSPLAPIHNPAALAVIRAARAAYPDVAHVAVFDTGFHATLSDEARTYPLDRRVAAEHGLRRYGFHGISVRHVRDRTAVLLGRPVTELNTIVLHLGNGASATALAGGVSVETSMGMSPLSGLMMGTRTGDLDPEVTFQLARAGWTVAAIEDLYQHRGGLFGLCGDNDVRVVTGRAAAGDETAVRALAVYCHRIRLYVGAYHAVLGRLDAIVFTAGVGEHSAVVRARALAGLTDLGIEVDPVANAAPRPPCVISTSGSRVAVCVVAADEERAIAADVGALLDLPGW